MPAQARNQACAVGAVVALQVALQVIARVAGGAYRGQAQAHIH